MPFDPSAPYRAPDEPIDLPVADDAGFWSAYPSDRSAFAEFARTPGIWLRCRVGVVGIRDGRYSQPIGLEETRRRLPRPPEGYTWVLDNGGLRDGSYHTFRLWRASFGYMPHSE